MLIFGYRLQLWQCIEAGCISSTVTRFTFIVRQLPGLRLLLEYCYDYAIHGSLYTSAHVSTAQMAKNSCMVLCYQNRVSKGTNQCYELHVSACTSVHSASVMVLGLLKKKKKKKKKN